MESLEQVACLANLSLDKEFIEACKKNQEKFEMEVEFDKENS